MNLNERESLLLIEHMKKASTANHLAIEALEKGREVLRRMKSIESQTHITVTESEWTTGANPQADKMVRVHINFGPVRHVGHISNDGIWTVYDLDGDSEPCETIKHYFGIVLSWRELTEEENTMCWERGILGSSEEHAELSTLELPIDKQEPEWRPMSAAPTNGELILARTFSGIEIYVSFDFSALECHWRDTDNNGWSYEDLTGWRPL